VTPRRTEAAELRSAGQPGGGCPHISLFASYSNFESTLALQIGGQQAVEQLFSSFAAYGQAAGTVGT
jgi:hypothetical protein